MLSWLASRSASPETSLSRQGSAERPVFRVAQLQSHNGIRQVVGRTLSPHERRAGTTTTGHPPRVDCPL